VICDPCDVVVVPFPFTEQAAAKRRPALVLSPRPFNECGHTIMAMITTGRHLPWPGDTEIEDLQTAGLRAPCRVRMKLFTLDNRLIVRIVGRLSDADRRRAAKHVRESVDLTTRER
jgi:mRNA interferase MazF